MGTKKKDNKTIPYKLCAAAVVVFFGIFTARLADWQLIHGAEYRALADSAEGFTIKTEAVRGEILDRYGNGLVTNKTHYRIVINKLYADPKKLDSTLLSLARLLEKAGVKTAEMLPIEENGGRLRFKKNAADEVRLLLSDEFLGLENTASAQECFDALSRRYELWGRYSGEDLLTLVSLRYSMEREGYSAGTPFVVADDVSAAAAAAVSENYQEKSGVEAQTYCVRDADKPTLAPHIIGALGAISAEEYEALSDKSYALTDSVGKFGIESAFEEVLRGKSGEKAVKISSGESAAEEVEISAARPGGTVWLTIDSKLQKIAADSLERNIKAANAEGKLSAAQGGERVGEDCETGAAVMLDVRDFSVLAAASFPGYDLNRYSEYGDYYVSLAENPLSPMYNRAFSGSFACGSVFKPCVALAALEEGKIKTETEIFCGGVYDFYPSNAVHCMHVHNSLNFRDALVQSCNCFYAETGRLLGIGAMSDYAEKMGLGVYTGLEIEESKGTLAGRDSDDWQAGNTVQAAIGQSDNAFTPVQLATFAATIANGGVRLKTHIVSKITDYERQKTLADYSLPQKVCGAGISPKNLAAVQSAMLGVTQSASGTANSFFGGYKVEVAAKTGTAENSGSDHATFICYAPYEKPEVAVAVVIEHGVKGKYPMSVAMDLLDGYFSQRDNTQQ